MAGDGPAPASVPACLRTFLELQSARAKLYARFDLGHKAFMRNKAESTFRCLMSDLTAAFSDCSRQVIALEAALKDMGRPDLAAILRSVQECERDKLRLTLALQALRQAAAFRTFSWLHQGQGGEAAAAEEEALALLDPNYRPGHQCHHGHGHGHGHGHANQQQQQQQQEEEESIGQAETARNGQAGEEAQANGSAGGTAQAAGGQGLGMQHDDAAACGVAAEQAGSGQAGVNGTADAGQAAAPPAHTHTHEAGACGACGSAGDAGPPEPTRREYEAAVKEAMQELDACIRKINDAQGDVRMELEDEA